MRDRYIGLDIGGTKCAVLLAEVDGGIHILDKLRFPTDPNAPFEATFAQLCQGVEQVLERNGTGLSRVRHIGVSCGGPLDSRSGVVLCPPNLPTWIDVPFARLLTERFGVPAHIMNDANACALVEWKLGAGRGVQDMIFLTMGTGMGAGVISGGRLLIGRDDLAGEVGHLRIAPDGPVGFGKAGSFEGFSSGGGIDRQARAMTNALIAKGAPPKWIEDGHTPDEVCIALLAQYARSGDETAIEFFKAMGTRLGQGVALLVDAFNPERVVIGSVFVRCEELLRPTMEAALKQEAIPHSLRHLKVLPAGTGESLGDFASIMVALHAENVDPMDSIVERDERVLSYYNRLFARHPALEACLESVMETYQALIGCYRHGGKLLLVGDGGDFERIAKELTSGFLLRHTLPDAVRNRLPSYLAGQLQGGLPAIALTTATQNDVDPPLGFAQQVISLARPGDALLVISASGESKDALYAAEAAKALGLTTIALTGKSSGMLKGVCDIIVAVSGTRTVDAQELRLCVYHCLCAMLEAKLFQGE